MNVILHMSQPASVSVLDDDGWDCSKRCGRGFGRTYAFVRPIEDVREAGSS